MKSTLILVISKLFLFFFFISTKTLEKGKYLFVSNCVVCHNQGDNFILPEKNLKQKTLEENGMYNIDAIMYQVTNGKNGMPAFGGRLTEKEIEEVSCYVLKKSTKNFMEE